AWNLPAVGGGTAGAGLLDTYDVERRPVCDLVVEQAYTRYVLRVDPTLSRENLAAPMDDASIELGPVYRSAGLRPEGRDDGAALEDPRRPTGRVGVRAPHLPVEIAGTPGSVHDVLGRGFVLLGRPGGQRWLDAALPAGVALGCPVSGYRMGPDGDLVDKGETFARAYGLGPHGAVLVRPDAVVAWRAPADAGDPRSAVEGALRRLLFRQPRGSGRATTCRKARRRNSSLWAFARPGGGCCSVSPEARSGPRPVEELVEEALLAALVRALAVATPVVVVIVVA